MPPLSPEALACGRDAAHFILKELRELKAFPGVVRLLAAKGDYPRSEVITRLCVAQLRFLLEGRNVLDALDPVMKALARTHPVNDRVEVGGVKGMSVAECLRGIAERLFTDRLEFLGAARVLRVVRDREVFRELEKKLDPTDLCKRLPWVLSPAASGHPPPRPDDAEEGDPEWVRLQTELADDTAFAAAVRSFRSNQLVFRVLDDCLAFDPEEVGPQLEREFAHAERECAPDTQALDEGAAAAPVPVPESAPTGVVKPPPNFAEWGLGTDGKHWHLFRCGTEGWIYHKQLKVNTGRQALLLRLLMEGRGRLTTGDAVKQVSRRQGVDAKGVQRGIKEDLSRIRRIVLQAMGYVHNGSVAARPDPFEKDQSTYTAKVYLGAAEMTDDNHADARERLRFVPFTNPTHDQ